MEVWKLWKLYIPLENAVLKLLIKKWGKRNIVFIFITTGFKNQRIRR